MPTDAPGSGRLGEFVSPAVLKSPHLTSPLSAWNEHVPFAGWIAEVLRPKTLVELGTHAGVSYFAFCEALLQTGADSRCYAVDHWKGDRHAGEYGEEVFAEVSRLNQDRYSTFSTLLRKSFDEALDDFAPGSVDLLHIDGLHTYEAVKHDFEAWLPKMSNVGVVLLHDTAEHKTDFGVYRLLEELRHTYPTFEFQHGHGLGIIAVGSVVPEPIHKLITLGDGDPNAAQMVRDLYRRLGRRLELEIELEKRQQAASELAARRRQLETVVKRLEAEKEELRAAVETAKAEVGGSRREVTNLRSSLESQSRELVGLRESLEAHRQVSQDLQTEVGAARRRIVDLETSTSWRVTKPVRWVGDLGRSLARRLRKGPSAARPAATTINRLYEDFDTRLDRATRKQIKDHLQANPALNDALVSVIMPTFNRGDIVGAAIASVIAQTHSNWELLIVDDGSTDDTASIVAGFADDPRIKYFARPRSGVGAARNHGLQAAVGEIISYLDSDNEWDPEFLSLMVAGLHLHGAEIGYSATRLIEDGAVAGYRGDVFDFEECLAANYIDINSFCHRKSISESVRFEPQIRRTNDWDFILAITHLRQVVYLPFVGAHYTQSGRTDQITAREPYLFRRLVEERHRARHEGRVKTLETFDQVLDRTPLTFAIRTAGPRDVRHLWGDHHFGVGLAQAFERLGHTAKVYYLGEGVPERTDVVMVLRGLAYYTPQPDSVNVIWNISHPDQVEFKEFDSFDIAFVASESYQRMLSHTTVRAVGSLLQATDRGRFFPHSGVERNGSLLFVGNSRKVERPSVRHAIDAGLPLVIHGSGWEGIVPKTAVRSAYLPNEEASRAYAEASAVLNDHWESMRDYGFISNRVFDALASGATVISDSFPELERVLGDRVETFTTNTDFIEVAQRALADRQINGADAALEIIEEHSLDARAASILDAVRAYLGRTNKASSQSEPSAPLPSRRRSTTTRIGVLPQVPAPGRMTSSAYVRLIQPLTSDLHRDVELTVIDPEHLDDIGGMEYVVASRTAMTDIEQAESLLRVTDGGARLAVDLDDGFHLMDDSHPQFEMYRELIPPLTLLMDEAEQLWCSTEALRDSLSLSHQAKATVLANTLDPRLWRRYRHRGRSPREPQPLELLYMGSTTHGPDLDLLLPALEQMYAELPGCFRLTVIGVAPSIPDYSWIQRLTPKNGSAYPHFATWLRTIAGDFDLAMAPLADSKFNRLKSDLKLMEYTALGLPILASPMGPYQLQDSAVLCEGVDEWYKSIHLMVTDQRALDERRIHAAHSEAVIWEERRSSIAGETILRLVST